MTPGEADGIKLNRFHANRPGGGFQRFQTVASRFRIACAVTVAAASLTGEMFSDALLSPIRINFMASSGFPENQAIWASWSEDKIFASFASGFLPVANRNASRICPSKAGPPSRIALSARTRAASTNCTSLSSTKAWSGVLVVGRYTVQASRLGASKAIMLGRGEVRFQTL